MNKTKQNELQPEWATLTAANGIHGNESVTVWTVLENAYNEAWRHYHNLVHIGEMLALLPRFDTLPDDTHLLKFAIWFHDVVYRPESSDNEAASATLATHYLQRWQFQPDSIREISRLINLTKSHQTTSSDHLGQIMLDADLAILSSAPARYEEYARQIRAEYACVDAERYKLGRTKILKSFMLRPRIYLTAIMASRESFARANIRWELAELGAA